MGMENNVPAQPAAPAAEPARLTLEAIYTDKIFETTQLRQLHWMQDGRRFSFLDTVPDTEVTTLWIYDIDTGQRIPIIAAETLKLPDSKPEQEPIRTDAVSPTDSPDEPKVIPISGYQWSPDETRLLLAHLPHRRASQGDKALYIYTLATRELRKIAESEHEYRNAKWSPDGTTIGYVRQDDIFLLEIATGRETRLTATSSSTVYNGRFGWVYEEELALADGWAFSPDGRYVSYFQVDETSVPLIDLPDYDHLHMKPVQIRYPKAGDPNPLVRVGVIALENGRWNPQIPQIDTDLSIPEHPNTESPNTQYRTPEHQLPTTLWLDLGPDADNYISRMQWTPTGKLLLHRIPRLQNRIELLLVDPAAGTTEVILAEEEDTWVDVRGDLTFIKDTDQFLWPSCRDGYNHLYLYDLGGQLIRQLTQGAWEVDKVVSVDVERRSVYFTAANPEPRERQLFRVSLDGGDIVRLTAAPGSHEILFSPGGQYYLDTYSSIAAAPRTSLCRADGELVAVVHTNALQRLNDLPLSRWEFTTFQTGDGVTLHAAILRPSDFDPGRRYPVLMHTYGGPGSQVVRDQFGNGRGLEQFFAAHGYIYALVDGRGSGMRGRDFEKVIYLNLGNYEVQDQIEGAKWLSTLPYVDPQRIGIWGWSYGGYMASLCILRGAEVFRSAAAVAPVTHWTLYDTIYTERYMRRPEDNPQGYAQTSPLTDAAKLKGKFLLVHGLADDNVHFQNAARLAQELQKENKPFRAMYYPGKHHGLQGVAPHWAALITNFFLETL
jgi:dipeptidyl-peptidase-4